MGKYHGKIGYAKLQEIAPGVWQEVIIEKTACGDVNRLLRRLVGAEQVNDNIKLNQEISIVADKFASENFQYIRYATYMGAKWKVNAVDASQYPRLVLDMGEIYNAYEEEPETEENENVENETGLSDVPGDVQG
jgi:hypothetical protein